MRKRNSLIYLRGCLHAKFHLGMKLDPRRNHPCLWWNVSYCLHGFCRDEISSRDELIPFKKTGMKKRKKTCKHFISGWNFKMSIFFFFFFFFDVCIQICFPKLACLNIMKILWNKRLLYKKWCPKRKRMRTISKI